MISINKTIKTISEVVKLDKKGQIQAFVWIVLAIVVGLGIFAVVGSLLGWNLFGGGALSQVQDDESDVLQVSDTTPTFTFNCFDAFNKGSTASGCNIFAHKVNGEEQGADSDGAIEVDCGDRIEALINATSYYATRVVVDEVPCTENPSKSVYLKNWDTAPDLQIYCQDDGLINAKATATEGLPANAVDTQTAKIYASYRDCTQDGAFFISYVSTYIDKITSSLGSGVQKPKYLTYNTSDSNVQDQMYVFPIGDMCNNEITEFTFTIDVAGTAFNKDNMTVGIIDKDWYVDSDGSYKYDYEDEDNNDLGQSAPSSNPAYREMFYTATS